MGNYGIFLTMGKAGFIPSTVVWAAVGRAQLPDGALPLLTNMPGSSGGQRPCEMKIVRYYKGLNNLE